MDKKTVISDFRSLKGKFILSENERHDTQENTTVKESQKPEETQLRVGQSVVLMDSNLRGRIIRLGRTVTIELEDGLVIESVYGDFAVTDKTEIESLKETKLFPEVETSLKASNCSSRWRLSEKSSDRTCIIEE